ncbi:hypothetical protein Val02_63500 [Virgisporangium aliadipatigenens]|uniref:Uncharacterized protein n=1 Tax=Virgisporangium aliadipatigenens TaxID=741659 RepID=A0A8J4DT63_9ACTN|nr:hypothetical protein [Virgisporangium aliadipatigenens]GIJ49464.1 hypothetical protein Val02_63500 [Virgisporangium aliadipatigenens]
MVVVATSTATADPGPAAGPWTTAGALDPEGHRLDLLVVPGSGGVRYAVLAEPRVRRVAGGGRLFSATVIHHSADDDTVERVVLSFDVDTAPPAVALESLRETTGVTHLALFPRRTTVRLVDAGTGRVLGTGSAPTGSAALTCTLDGAAARAAHDAIAGRPGTLAVHTELEYRVAGVRVPRLGFDLAAVHDRLAGIAAGAPLPAASLAGHLRDLILAGVVRAEPSVDGRTATAELAVATLPAFLRAAAPILHPQTQATPSPVAPRHPNADPSPDPVPADPPGPDAGRLPGREPAGALGPDAGRSPGPVSADPPRPDAGPTPGSPAGEGALPADRYLLGERPADGRWVETADPSAGTGRIEQRIPLERLVAEVLRRGPRTPYVRALTTAGARTRAVPSEVRTDPRSAPMVTVTGRITTRWNAVRPQPVDPGPDAHALLAATAGTADPAAAPERWVLPDGVLAAPGPGPEPDGSDLWPDRVDPAIRWYAPTFTLVGLTLTQSTGDLMVVAAVVPDPAPPATAPWPALPAHVPDAVAPAPPATAAPDPGTAAAAAPGTTASPDPRHDPRPLPLDDLSAALHLPYRDADGRPRTAAIPATGVRADAERLEFTFAVAASWADTARAAMAGGAWRTARLSVAYTFAGWVRERATPVLGPMTLRLPVVEGTPGHGTTVDARSGVIRFDDGAELPPRDRPSVAVHVAPSAVPPEPVRHVRRTHGRAFAVELIAPGLDAPPAPPPGPVHEAVPVDAAPTGTTILRVRPAPGRFVLVPAAYTITRHGPEEGERAYRPALAVHGTIDPPRCLLTAGLHPDLTPAQRHAIEVELRARHHPAPVLEHVTAVPAGADVRWERPVATVRSPEGFQIGVDTDGAGAAELESALVAGGVRGRVTFTLSDGTTAASELVLDLARISGPWTGPVATGLADDVLALTNRIEAPVGVADVIIPGAPGGTVPVERVLEPGAGVVVRVPPGSVGHLVSAAVRAAPTGLSDIRANVDEVVFDVVFLNLVDPAGIAVTARPVGARAEHTVALPPGTAAGGLTLTLAVNAFLARPVLEYRVRRSATGATGAWHTWDLARYGHVVAVTRDRAA